MRLGWLKVLVVSVALLLIGAGTTCAVAATIYVDSTNIGEIEDGSLATPFNTIQEAMARAVPGDVVSAAPGIYYGSFDLINNVTIVSQKGPASTIIDGLGWSYVVRSPGGTTNPIGYIDGFTLRNAGAIVNIWNSVSFWANSNVVISNCIIEDGGYAGIDLGPGGGASISKTVIKNIGLSNWGGIESGAAIEGIWCRTPSLKNVTIDRTSRAFTMYQYSAYLTNTTITNVHTVAELWGNWGWGSLNGTNNNVWNYTQLFQPNWRGWLPYYGLTGTLNVDPLFVDVATGNYQLSDGSPLIDAGVNVGLSFEGSAPDIGAYEHSVSIPQMMEALSEAYYDVPLSAYKNVGEQRRHALHNKFMALLKTLASLQPSMTTDEQLAVYRASLDKLINDIWAKGDSFYGGQAQNDWITTKEEQDRLYEKVMEISNAIQGEIARLSGS